MSPATIDECAPGTGLDDSEAVGLEADTLTGGAVGLELKDAWARLGNGHPHVIGPHSPPKLADAYTVAEGLHGDAACGRG